MRTVWLVIGTDGTGSDVIAVCDTEAGAHSVAQAAENTYLYGINILEYDLTED